MNFSRWILIGLTFILAAIFTFYFYIWSDEFKADFLYRNDYLSLIMVFVLVMAITGIFRWLLTEEIILTDPKRKRRRKR